MKNEKDNNDELRIIFGENNVKFRFTEFFEKSRSRTTGVAISVITSKQIITTMTENDGSDGHLPTIHKIIQAIYDLPPIGSSSELLLKYCQYIDSAILIRIWFQDDEKWVMVQFPEKITQGQLNLLAVYQRLYGSEFESISREHGHSILYSEDLELALVKDKKRDEEYTFERVVEFAQTLVSEKEIDTGYEHIIGFTEKKLVEFIVEILKKREATLTNCNEIGEKGGNVESEICK